MSPSTTSTPTPKDDTSCEPSNDTPNVVNWDDAWVTRSTQELRLLVAALRMRDPELSDFENDSPESIAQAKPGLHARVHFPPTMHERSGVHDVEDRDAAPSPKSAT